MRVLVAVLAGLVWIGGSAAAAQESATATGQVISEGKVLAAALVRARITGSHVQPQPDLRVVVIKNNSLAWMGVASAFAIPEGELWVSLIHPLAVPQHFFNHEPLPSVAEKVYEAGSQLTHDSLWWHMTERMATRGREGRPATVLPSAEVYITNSLLVSAAWRGKLRFSFRELVYQCSMEGDVLQLDETRSAFFSCNLESVKSR